MIEIRDFQKFFSIVDELKSSGIPVKVFGFKKETYVGARIGFDPVDNNSLSFRLAALTALGTFYFQGSAKLAEPETVSVYNELYSKLNVSEAQITIDDEKDKLTIR